MSNRTRSSWLQTIYTTTRYELFKNDEYVQGSTNRRAPGQGASLLSRIAQNAPSNLPYWPPCLLKTQYLLYVPSYALLNVQWSLAVCHLRTAMRNVLLRATCVVLRRRVAGCRASERGHAARWLFSNIYATFGRGIGRHVIVGELVLLPTGFSPWIVIKQKHEFRTRTSRQVGQLRNF